MEKIKKVISSPLFISAACGVIGIILIVEQHPLYAGSTIGFGIAKFLEAFKTDL
jgi:hypothetical protein|tara:strand:- start:39 stop:200 length:162 start_codon:yes stop_codon:yes gene_type:complete